VREGDRVQSQLEKQHLAVFTSLFIFMKLPSDEEFTYEADSRSAH